MRFIMPQYGIPSRAAEHPSSDSAVRHGPRRRTRWKQAILQSAGDATTVTTAFTGLPARVLRNRFVADYEATGAPVLPGLLQASLEEPIWTAARRDDRPDYYPMYAGQSVGVIKSLPAAGDVVRSIVEEATAVLQSLCLPAHGV